MKKRESNIKIGRREVLKGMAGFGVLAVGEGMLGASTIDQTTQKTVPRAIPHMKITAVDTILTGSNVFVKISTNEGITGYGDATNNFVPNSVIGMLKDIVPYLIGEDPQRIEYLWQSCFRRRFYRGGPATGTALSGIDQALWDIKGKACGMPVYQLLGGLARTKVRVYGHITGDTAAEAANQAKQRVAKGITAIRFRAFHSYDKQNLHDHKLAVEQQIEYLAAVREAVGEDIDLILECHGRYDPVWALKLAILARPYHPFMIEDPISHENPEALARMREHTDIALATGERYHNLWDCRETIVNQYVDYLRPDITHCCGISEMMKIGAMAQVYFMNLIPHNNAGPLGSAATLHAALSIQNIALIEAPWVNSDQIPKVVKPFPKVENGYALPLEGPGLGVEFDEAEAAAIPFRENALQPRLNGIDGSVRDF